MKAHLSVIGAAIALMKAAGYLIAKWELVNSTNGYVQGATYTDIHARMPALTILFWLSLASAGILCTTCARAAGRFPPSRSGCGPSWRS